MVVAVEWWKVRQRKSSRLVISFKVQTLQNLKLSKSEDSSEEKCGLGLDWKHSCCVWRKGESEGSIRFHHERLIIKEQVPCLNEQSFEIEAC